MTFPSKNLIGRTPQKNPAPVSAPVSNNAWRSGVILTFLVGCLLLVDQQLETVFDAAEILEIDVSSYQVTTAKASFLATYPNQTLQVLEIGMLLEMEYSPITKTVVAYRPFETTIVESPRETIFTYWPITALMTVVSIFLLTQWNSMHKRIELLMLNLILLVIVSVLYFISH